MFFNRRLKVKTFNRRNEKIKKRLFPIIMITLIILGFIYQQFSIHFTASHLGRMGRLVNVEGVNMHLYEAGTGDIPIVFTANIGSSTPYVDLYPIHSILSDGNKVMVYDRPGYGWSDTTSKARSIDNICKEIYAVLHSNDVPDDEDESLQPFVFVAQGMSALEAIRYAQLYPDDVAGIVFIEGTSPSFCADYNNIMIIESFITNGMRNIGFLRMMGNTKFTAAALNDNPELSPELRHLNKGLGLDHAWNRNVISEKLNVSNNAQTIIDNLGENNLGSLPIRVITSKANVYSNWNRCQNALLSLSSDSKQVVINNSTTVINQEDVPAIVSSIEELVSHIRELREDLQ